MQHGDFDGFTSAVKRDMAMIRGEMRELRKMMRPADQRRDWPAAPAPVANDQRKDIERHVREMLEWRRTRETIFGAELFADPAWDILLEMFAAELADQRVTISELCRSAAVPYTTGLRWVTLLEEKGVILRREDPLDRRRVFMLLADKTSANLGEFFRRMLPEPGFPLM